MLTSAKSGPNPLDRERLRGKLTNTVSHVSILGFAYKNVCDEPNYHMRKQMLKKDEQMNTPLQAIRSKCRWCCLDQLKEIELCRSEKSCPVWPLRFGKSVKGISPLKAIRTKCLDCVGDSPSEVKVCDQADGICALWPFRFGTNPNYSDATREACRQRRLNSLRKMAKLRADSDSNRTRAG